MYQRNEEIWKGYINDDLTGRECNDGERLSCRVQADALVQPCHRCKRGLAIWL
jgi:hypothetical protein